MWEGGITSGKITKDASLTMTSDTRGDLLNLLARYRPENNRDRLQKEIIEQFIRNTPNCFERSHFQGHITGSAWVVDETGTQVLLTHHKKLGVWVQLGGHSDGNPDTLEVALREAREESGLENLEPAAPGIFDVDVHSIPAWADEPAHLHYDIRFAFKVVGQARIRKNAESHALSWISMADLSNTTAEESLHRMARKWKQLY